jgi:hypothetical protein
VVLVLGLALAAAACSGDDSGGSATTTTEGGPKVGVLTGLERLPTMAPADVCALVADGVVESALGVSIVGEPDGIEVDGLGTNCVWRGSDELRGPRVKLEFNTLTWVDASDLADLGVSQRRIVVAGHDAVQYGTLDGVAAVVVRLGEEDDTALYVDAPDSTGARDVAEAAMVSLAER